MSSKKVVSSLGLTLLVLTGLSIFLNLDLLVRRDRKNDHTIEVSVPLYEIQQYLNQHNIPLTFEPKIYAIDRPYWFKSNHIEADANEIIVDLKTWTEMNVQERTLVIISCLENNFINKKIASDHDSRYFSFHSIRNRSKNEIEAIRSEGFVRDYSAATWLSFSYNKIDLTDANFDLDNFFDKDELTRNIKDSLPKVLDRTLKNKVLNKSTQKLISEIDL